jgi:hypothetical protein
MWNVNACYSFIGIHKESMTYGNIDGVSSLLVDFDLDSKDFHFNVGWITSSCQCDLQFQW